MDKQTVACLMLGLLAGAGVGIVAYFAVSKAVDAQLAQGGVKMLEQGEAALSTELIATLNREVPPKVRAAVQEKLDAVGLDATTGQRISRLLAAADRMGVI